jgi:serine/threonine-protein kinase RsbW
MAQDVLQYVLPSDFAKMREAQSQILAAVAKHHFDDESVHAIRLALEEGLINAIKHGNKLDPKKTVDVDCKVDDKKFWIRIHDQGAGFKRKDVPDPTLEENLEKPSGRGLLLMEAYMTSVKYTDGGRCLTMSKLNGATSDSAR